MTAVPSTAALIDELVGRYSPDLDVPPPARPSNPTGARSAAGVDGHSRLADLLARHAHHVHVPPPAALDQVRRNVELHVALLAEYGALTLPALADRQPGTPAEAAARVQHWHRQQQILTVTWRGQMLLPGFQFTADLRPHPIVGDVLAAQADHSDWARAVWWVLPHDLLDDACPVDLLGDAPVDRHQPGGRQLLTAATAPAPDWF